MKSARFLFSIAALIFASLACNLLNRGAEAIQESVPPLVGTEAGIQPEDLTPAPPQSTGQESGSLNAGDPYDFDNPLFAIRPELFNTYKSSIDYSFSAANGITGSLVMEGATRLDPYASAIHMTSSGAAIVGTDNSIQFAQVDGNEYVYSEGFGCMAGLQGLQGSPFDIAVDTYGVLTGKAQYSGEESVNGVDALVYTITEENLSPQDGTELGFTELADGRIWLAKDGGFVVRMLLAGRGVNEGLSQDPTLEGDLVYEINFFDFDQPVDIVVPEGCAETATAGTQVPLPEDAADITQFGDILSFSTGLSLSDAADFFERELPGKGCSEPEVVGDGSTMTSLNFSNCEFGSVQIILTVDQGRTVGTVFIAP